MKLNKTSLILVVVICIAMAGLVTAFKKGKQTWQDNYLKATWIGGEPYIKTNRMGDSAAIATLTKDTTLTVQHVYLGEHGEKLQNNISVTIKKK